MVDVLTVILLVTLWLLAIWCAMVLVLIARWLISDIKNMEE